MNQESIDYFSKKVEELIDGIDSGDFAKEIIPDKYKWEHLLGLFILRDSLDGGDELFEQLYDVAIKSGQNYLRQKAQRGEKIRVSFQSYSAAQWPAEQVYRSFEKNPDLEVQVVVSPLSDRKLEDSLDTYNKTLSWFKENGYKVVEGIDFTTRSYRSWEEMGEYPDVLYQLSSWFQNLPTEQWFAMLPLRCLVAYIPYGIHLVEDTQGAYTKDIVYNKEIANLIWRVYCDSRYNLLGYQQHQLLKGKNVRYSGYAKMDYFLEKHDFAEDEVSRLWSIPEGKRAADYKKVIIAPHYSIMNHGGIHFSTFHKNAWFWLYLAEKYQDKVSFLFKPHPNLRSAAVGEGLFESYEEYDNYVSRWNELPNARSVDEAMYLDYFTTSDAMIMDSGSFLGEYLYTGKPLLFLTRPEQGFTGIGEKIVSAYYQTPGENFAEIERFLEEVVIGGKDTMQDTRAKIFAEELDYKTSNGVGAAELICGDLMNVLDGKE